MSSIKSSFADAAGGVAGSLVAMLAFYPIDVLKTNLQAEKSNGESDNNGKIVDKNRNLQTVIRHMRSKYPSNLDFLKALFKGLHFKTAHTTTSSFAYFFIYSWIQSKHKMHALSSPGYRNGGKYQPSTVVRLLLSAIAAMCNTALTLPLDVLASRSQITHTVKPDDHTNQITPPVTSDDEQTLQEEKKEDDTPRTIIPHDSSQKIMENVWRNVNDIDSDGDYDTANEEGNIYNDDGISFDSGDTGKKDESACQASFIEDEDDNISYASTNIDKNEVVNREYEEQVDSGVSKEIPTYVRPLFRVDTLTQPFPKHLVYTLSLLNKTKREDVYKLTELWRGIRPSLLLCSNPSIHFTVFDTVKDFVLKYKARSNVNNGEVLSMGEAFLIGLVAKFAATIATYPLIRAKVMLMVAKRNISIDCAVDDDTMMGILRSMFMEGGVIELYKGCSLQLVHALLKSALLMMVRERITVTTRRLILG